MYNFIDVNEVSAGGTLPAEALQINGDYIEDLIPGYRTLGTSGRESLSPEINSYEVGVRDGSVIKNRRYPARTISVKYQLVAASSEEFRAAYNKLGGILNVDDAILIFNDEPDMYYTGTPSGVGAVEAGSNAVTGEFTIYCADPFKYSVIEYTAEPDPDDDMILVDYNGTYKCYPTLEASFAEEDDVSDDGESDNTLTGNGDCGYVAFFDENKHIIQLGDPDEVDTASLPKSQTLISNSFKKSTSWGTSAKSKWAVNSGKTLGTVTQNGKIAMAKDAKTMLEVEADVFADNLRDKLMTAKTTLLTVSSTAEPPTVNYKIVCEAVGRTASTVKLRISITASLGKNASYFGKGYTLKAHVYVGGTWLETTLKDSKTSWKGKTAHTKTVSKTITGLSASATSVSGIKFKATRPDGKGKAGVISEKDCKNATIKAYVEPDDVYYYLEPSNYGSGSGWHGVTISRKIPADAAGETGATDFSLSYSHSFAIGSAKGSSSQRGCFQILLTSGTNRNVVAGITLYKSAYGEKATLRYYVNDEKQKTQDISVAYTNNRFIESKTSTIIKSGKKVSFNIGGIKKTFEDDSIASLAADRITIAFLSYGTKPALLHNGLYSVKFVKNKCTTWKDIPNKFSANDVVKADCKTGEVYLNGVSRAELGALGNDYETFCLQPGYNVIGFSYSDWVPDESRPDFKVKYREVFL